jgi:hypothetical protein
VPGWDKEFTRVPCNRVAVGCAGHQIANNDDRDRRVQDRMYPILAARRKLLQVAQTCRVDCRWLSGCLPTTD